MMMINSFKIKLIIIFLIILLMNLFIPTNSLAIEGKFPDMDPNQFNNGSYNTASDTNIGSAGSIGDIIRKIAGSVLAIVRIIALSWAIIMLISVAIKYMSSSPQIKAQLKTDVPTYLIGAVILFGTAGILTLIESFVLDSTSTNTN